MARKKKADSNQLPIEQYEHKDKQRLNNPPVVAVKIIDARGIESLKIIREADNGKR